MAINYSALMEVAKTASSKPKTTVKTASTPTTKINTNDQAVANTFNQAAAILSGNPDSYVPGMQMNTSYWGSTANGGQGGKNQLFGNNKSYKAEVFTPYEYQAAQKVINDYNAQKAAEAKAQQEAEYAQMAQTYIQPYITQLESGLAQNQAALQNAQKLSADQINNAYDLSARDYYQLYKTQQAKLPENLSKAGVTGGASESAQLKLMNNYSENLYKNEAARNNQLAGVNKDYNNQIAQNSINAANQMANAYLQMAQQQLSYKRQDELAAKEQQAQAELQAQQSALEQEVAQWNANVQNAMRKRLADGKTVWTWTADDGKIHWTTDEAKGLAMGGKKLSPSSSKVKSSGGSSTYSGGSGGSNNTTPVAVETTTPTSATSYSYDTLKYNMTNALLKGATKSQLQTFVNPIEASYKSGKITEKQARELLKMLGA